MNNLSSQPTYLIVTAVKDEDDDGGEDDGDQAGGEAEDPVVIDGDEDVEGREHGTPQHDIQQLVGAEETRCFT